MNASKQDRREDSASGAPEIPHDRIAERARRLWIERGRPGGRDLEHWLDAERQLREEMAGRARPVSRESEPRAGAPPDADEAECRLDGLIEEPPSPARRTPSGEQL